MTEEVLHLVRALGSGALQACVSKISTTTNALTKQKRDWQTFFQLFTEQSFSRKKCFFLKLNYEQPHTVDVFIPLYVVRRTAGSVGPLQWSRCGGAGGRGHMCSLQPPPDCCR